MRIHPLALVDPEARLGADVSIGPFSIVEAGVEIGDRCVLESRVVVKQGTILGSDNHVFEGAVLGGLPQHVRVPARTGQVRIGSHNTLRENVTVHRALEPDHTTTIGDHNLLMVAAHIAHDCRVGDQTIFANNAMLAGHVTVEDRAFLSGNVAVHQFCRVGQLAMVGGLARVVKDVPPFMLVDGGTNYVVGLNTVGLRRNGFGSDDLIQLKAAYRAIYRRGLTWSEILQRLAAEFTVGPAAALAPFLAASKRGIVAERRLPPARTLKLPQAEPLGERALRIKAG